MQRDTDEDRRIHPSKGEEHMKQNNIYLSDREMLILGQLVTHHTGEIAKYLKAHESLPNDKLEEIEQLIDVYSGIMNKLGEEAMK